jgi:hypothetical protein
MGILIEAAKVSARDNIGNYHYLENPGHHDPSQIGQDSSKVKYNPVKSILPTNVDVLELFRNSVVYKDTRYAIDDFGAIHQFQDSTNEGVYHWAGSESGVTKSGIKVKLTVPPEVVKMLRPSH